MSNTEDNSKICGGCKKCYHITEFTLYKDGVIYKEYKSCLKCRETAKNKYTPKPKEEHIPRQSYKVRQLPTEHDTNFWCNKCHNDMPINHFKDEDNTFYRTCDICRDIYKTEYISKKQPPKEKVFCEICKKHFVAHLYDYHCKSAVHKLNEQRLKEPVKRCRKRIINVPTILEKVDENKSS